MSSEENLMSQEDLVKRYLQEKLGEKLSGLEKENDSQHENLKKFLTQIEELKKVADGIESRLAKAKENEVPPLKISPPTINGEAKEPTPKGSDLTSPKNQDKKPKIPETTTQPKGDDKKAQPKENGISNKTNTSSPKKTEEKKPVEPKKKEEPKEEEKKDKKPKTTPTEPKQPVPKPVKDTKKDESSKDKDAKESHKDNKPAKTDKEDKVKPADKKDNKANPPKKEDGKDEKPVENRASKVLEELTPEKAIKSITKNDITEIKGYITPSAQALAVAKAFWYLLSEKEVKEWAELKKIYKDDKDVFAKLTALSLDTFKNDTLDSIEKWFKESNVTDESVKKTLAVQHVFRFIYSLLNSRNQAHKEPQEDKNKNAFVGAILDAADKKIAQEHKEEHKTEESPQTDAQQAEAKIEEPTSAPEEKKEEKVEEPKEEPKTEEPATEEPAAEEPKVEETKAEEPAVTEEPKVEEPKQEETSTENESKPKVDIEPVVTELSE